MVFIHFGSRPWIMIIAFDLYMYNVLEQCVLWSMDLFFIRERLTTLLSVLNLYSRHDCLELTTHLDTVFRLLARPSLILLPTADGEQSSPILSALTYIRLSILTLCKSVRCLKMALFGKLLNKKSSIRRTQNESSSTPPSQRRVTFADSNDRFRQRRPAIHAPQPRGHEIFSAFAQNSSIRQSQVSLRLNEINCSEERRAQEGHLPPLTSRPTEFSVPLPSPSLSQKKDNQPSPSQQQAETHIALSDDEEVALMLERFARLAVDCLSASDDVNLDFFAMQAVQTLLDEQHTK